MDTQYNVGLAKVEIRRVDKRKLLKIFQEVGTRLDYLFDHPIKFHPKYLNALNLIKLEIFLMIVNPRVHPKIKGGGVQWLLDMGERERRQIFQRAIKYLKVRKWTFEEIRSIYIALGYPAKRVSLFQRNVREAIQDLIKQLKRDIQL